MHGVSAVGVWDVRTDVVCGEDGSDAVSCPDYYHVVEPTLSGRS